MRRNHTTRASTARRFANGALAIALAAGLAPSTAFATEARTDEPGVIEQALAVEVTGILELIWA